MPPQPREPPEHGRRQQPEATDRRDGAAEQRQCDDGKPGREPWAWGPCAGGGGKKREIEDGRGDVADDPGVAGERSAEVLERMKDTEHREVTSPRTLRLRPGEWIVQHAIEVEREGGCSCERATAAPNDSAVRLRRASARSGSERKIASGRASAAAAANPAASRQRPRIAASADSPIAASTMLSG